MDKETFIKEMLKDFYKRYPYKEGRVQLCPFFDKHGVYLHDYCATLFPGWAKKYYDIDDDKHEGCPCNTMSIKYVIRKTRAFVKKK